MPVCWEGHEERLTTLGFNSDAYASQFLGPKWGTSTGQQFWFLKWLMKMAMAEKRIQTCGAYGSIDPISGKYGQIAILSYIYSQMSRSQEIQLRMSLQVPLRRQSRTGWLVGMPSEVALRNLSSDSSRVFNMFKCRSKLGMSNYAKNHGHCLQFPSSIIELTGCVSPHSYPGLHKHGELVVSVGHILAALRVQKELATELVEKNPCS